VRRSGEGVVEEMRRSDHPIPRRLDRAEAAEVVTQRVGALDREQPGDDPPISRAPRQERIQVRGGSEDGKCAARPVRGVHEAARHVDRPRRQVQPRGRRPAAAHGEQRDVV
jgi:hypothetical protein